MGFKRLPAGFCVLAVAMVSTAPGRVSAAVTSAEPTPAWPACDTTPCSPSMLSIITRNGTATIAVASKCLPGAVYRHEWDRREARTTPRRFSTSPDQVPADGVCVALPREFNEIEVTPAGGECGAAQRGIVANLPGSGGRLSREEGIASVTVEGCHAKAKGALASLPQFGFGGIALELADGYEWADYYQGGALYMTADAFPGYRNSQDLYDSLTRSHAYHYRIEPAIVETTIATAPALPAPADGPIAITPTASPSAAPLPRLAGWTVKGAVPGRAWVVAPGQIDKSPKEIDAGSDYPGLGTVRTITHAGSTWVIDTSAGIIESAP